MNLIRAELLKVLKTSFIWILSGAYIVLFLLLFYQFTLNSSANVIEPLLKDPINLSSFFLIMFAALLNVFFSVTLGSYIASKDYADNMIAVVVQSAGRYKSYVAKILVLFVITSCFTFMIFLLGILLGLFYTGEIIGFSFTMVLGRLLLSFFSTFLIGLLAMTVAILFKSTSKSNIICIITLLAQSFLPYGLSKYLVYLNPYFYLSSFSDRYYSNLNGLSCLSIKSTNNYTNVKNIEFLLLYVLICLTVQFVVYKRREYSQ